MQHSRHPRHMEPAPIVTVHLWSVPAHRVPDLLSRTHAWRLGAVDDPRPGFSKLLGTTRSGRFEVRATDPRRWLLLAAWPDQRSAQLFQDGPVVRRWQAATRESWRATLLPLSAHGRWAGRTPFSAVQPPGQRNGPVLVLTRARLRWRYAPRFWRASAAVGRELANRSPVRVAFGIGEAPVGWQGTLSVWDAASAVRDFAYRHSAHLAELIRSRTESWYAEELFARFAVVEAAGTIDGRDPLERREADHGE